MHKDATIAKLWESKLRRLIEKDSRSKIKRMPDSPAIVFEEEFEFHQRDQLAPPIEYLWKTEILNNWQKYWNTMERNINYTEEVSF